MSQCRCRRRRRALGPLPPPPPFELVPPAPPLELVPLPPAVPVSPEPPFCASDAPPPPPAIAAISKILPKKPVTWLNPPPPPPTLAKSPDAPCPPTMTVSVWPAVSCTSPPTTAPLPPEKGLAPPPWAPATVMSYNPLVVAVKEASTPVKTNISALAAVAPAISASIDAPANNICFARNLPCIMALPWRPRQTSPRIVCDDPAESQSTGKTSAAPKIGQSGPVMFNSSCWKPPCPK